MELKGSDPGPVHPREVVAPGTQAGREESTAASPDRERFASRLGSLVRAILESDDATVEQTIVDLTKSHRLLAPLTLTVGALILLLEGVKILFGNWRLSLVQALPAMWIWAAMLDFKLRVFKGKEFRLWYGWTALLLVAAIAVITAATFYLNAVFAVAVTGDPSAPLGPSFKAALERVTATLAWGAAVGLALGFSIVVVPRWGLGWFSLALGIVLAFLMVTYVTVPARTVGIRTQRPASRREGIVSALLSSAVGAIVCTPAYVLGRVGLVLLGSGSVAVLGGALLAVGLALQAGSSGAVKAVKISAKLVAGG